ncbi:MAG: hypothetical protein JWQ14_2940 [Adhaeribacter sp.]|nr:hypothetical protein [Adhaeribacter sp.]
MEELLRDIIGPDSNAINWWQMSTRGIFIFLLTLLLIRFGDKRIFSKNSAFDIALGVIMGSVLSRAITGNAPFLPTVFTSLVLVALHRILASLACHSSIGNFIKGKTQQLVKNGELLNDQMNKHRITQNDLEEAMRSNGKSVELKDIENAFLERSGSISIIVRK